MENRLPENLLEAVRYFSDPQVCHDFAVSMRWPEGITCPRCGSEQVGFVKTRRIWNCKGCKKQFSFKVGTIFEDSPLGLDKWLVALWMLTGAKNGISSCELARALGVTQKTAWFLLHRGRRVLQTGSIEKAEGTIEVDETFVGGKAKNMHYDKKQEKIQGRGATGKTVVLGILKRGNGAKDENGNPRPKEDRIYSQVQLTVVPDTTEQTLVSEIKDRVQEGSEVFTDAHKAYRALADEGFTHAFVDHAVRYVEGRVYTNGCENVWNLLDRMMHGTYTFCLPHHLFRYSDELAFRFNHRDGTDLTRFLLAMKRVEGKRLTYRELTESHLQHLAPIE